MKKEYIDTLIAQNRLSDLKLCTYSNPPLLPAKEWGYCILSMTDQFFYITNCIGNSTKMGELLFEIPISEMKNMVHSPRIRLTQTFRFTWRGEQFIVGPITKEMKKILGIKHKML